MSSTKPLISVLMPAYNVESYVENAVTAVLNQTYCNFEFIIIDDGSTDGTSHILNRLAKTDNRIRLFFNDKNIGLIKTLNKGLDLVQGEFVARTDSDDYAEPNWLEVLLGRMKANSDLLCVGSFCRYVVESGRLQSASDGILRLPILHDEILDFLITGSPFAHPSVMIRTECFARHHLRYNADYTHAEDYKLWLDISAIQGGGAGKCAFATN